MSENDQKLDVYAWTPEDIWSDLTLLLQTSAVPSPEFLILPRSVATFLHCKMGDLMPRTLVPDGNGGWVEFKAPKQESPF